MQENLKNLIDQSVKEIIERCASKKKIISLVKKHEKKIHFIPERYRVLGGLLQSMNIQFGNFIEILMKNLVENEDRYEILTEYSGKKSNSFSLPNVNEILIDQYISDCQTNDTKNLSQRFDELLSTIFTNNQRDDYQFSSFKHDIDLLFKDKDTNKIYYLEIKYNDDHDTGKFVDINRKFIKTYAYLLNEFNLTSHNDLVPILFFFNNKRMKGNIYVPEETNIRRGEAFFDEFLTTSYQSVDQYIKELSENHETIKAFDDLYNKVVKNS